MFWEWSWEVERGQNDPNMMSVCLHWIILTQSNFLLNSTAPAFYCLLLLYSLEYQIYKSSSKLQFFQQNKNPSILSETLTRHEECLVNDSLISEQLVYDLGPQLYEVGDWWMGSGKVITIIPRKILWILPLHLNIITESSWVFLNMCYILHLTSYI